MKCDKIECNMECNYIECNIDCSIERSYIHCKHAVHLACARPLVISIFTSRVSINFQVYSRSFREV